MLPFNKSSLQHSVKFAVLCMNVSVHVVCEYECISVCAYALLLPAFF